MSELSDFLTDFNKQVGITADEEKKQTTAPVAPVKSAADTELEKAKSEYIKIQKLYNQMIAFKVEKRLAAVKEIYEFAKTYHERKQPLIEQTKGIFKVLHPMKARQAQKALEALREENKKYREYLKAVSFNIRIDYKMGELIEEDGINKIYDWEIPLECFERIIEQIKTSSHKYPFAVQNLLKPNLNANDYKRATEALKEYLK